MRNFWEFKNLGDNKAELYLYGEIVSESLWVDEDCVAYKDFIKDLQSFNECDDIRVFINSCGGDVFAANAIYSQLKKHPAKINVEIEGICASAATIVAMAGDNIIAEKNSLIMIHNPTVGLMGYFDEHKLSKCQNSLNAVKRSIISAYLSRIDKTEEELSALMDNETWYTGEEAVNEGIIDGIFEFDKKDEALNYVNDEFAVFNNLSFDIGKFKNFPKEKIRNIKDIKDIKEKAFDEPFFNIKKQKCNSEEGKNMTIEEIKEKYPDVYDEIGKEAVLLERERLKAIDEIAESLPKDMVEKAKYVDVVSAQQLAYKAIVLNKQLAKEAVSDRALDNLEANVKDVLSQSENIGDEKSISLQRVVNFMNKDGRRS